MKNRIGKVAITLAIGLALTAGPVLAQGLPGPSEPCTVNGQTGTTETHRGQRVFMCWDGEWEFMYECVYSAGPGSYCIIL